MPPGRLIHDRPQADRRSPLTCPMGPRFTDSTRPMEWRGDRRFTAPHEPDGCPSNASILLHARCDSPLIQRHGFMPDDEGLSPEATYHLATR